MKKVIVATMILAVALCGCTDKTASGPAKEPIRTYKMSENKPKAMPTTIEPDPTQDVGQVSEPDQKTVNGNSLSYSEYFKYMLSNRAAGSNPVFSSESLNIAFAIYAQLVDEPDKALFDKFFNGKDYLAFEETDGFKIINRLWVNDKVDFNLASGPLVDKDIIYSMDMSDSDKATAFKNDYVSEQTSGFIDKTPTVFNDLTFVDAMNIIYFKDKWLDGDKALDEEATEFHNEDGSMAYTKMFSDQGDYILKTNNAMAYTMSYENGMTFTAILPNEGVSLSELDIDPFISGSAEYVDADVFAKFPEFEADSEYKANFADFGLPVFPKILPSITQADLEPPEITQVAKIKVDHTGTEAAAVTEVLQKLNSVSPAEKEVIRFIADRPFAYYITDTKNKDVAFMGAVFNIQPE